MVTSSNSRRSSPYFMSIAQVIDGEVRLSQLAQLRGMHPDLIRRMIDNISFISDHFRALKKEDKVNELNAHAPMLEVQCSVRYGQRLWDKCKRV
uniref:Transcriptional regulator n=1 Tax=Ascaris lumbricoides TaxID=6252 RepID=A0A0M3IXR9_ASCLU